MLSDQLSPDGAAALAEGQRTLLAGVTTLRAVPRELQETLWLVPLHLAVALSRVGQHLAVALSRVGQHLAAVDWLRTLYAYDRAAADRMVFAVSGSRPARRCRCSGRSTGCSATSSTRRLRLLLPWCHIVQCRGHHGTFLAGHHARRARPETPLDPQTPRVKR